MKRNFQYAQMWMWLFVQLSHRSCWKAFILWKYYFSFNSLGNKKANITILLAITLYVRVLVYPHIIFPKIFLQLCKKNNHEQMSVEVRGGADALCTCLLHHHVFPPTPLPPCWIPSWLICCGFVYEQWHISVKLSPRTQKWGCWF